MDKAHTFQNLFGEALDNHLMTEHGWDMRMVANRGTQNPNVGDSYAKEYHQNSHNVMDAQRAGLIKE